MEKKTRPIGSTATGSTSTSSNGNGEGQLDLLLPLEEPVEIPQVALELALGYVDDPRDRAAASLVCRHWLHADAVARRSVTVAWSYATSPDALARRFPCLESLKLKAKPRAWQFDLIPDGWGGAAAPWIAAFATPAFASLRSLHLRRAVVTDDDLASLARAKAGMLVTLKLERSTGFSTDALAVIARSCKKLETLFLGESLIDGIENGEWLHELAVSNSVLETLNFFLTQLQVSPADLNLLIRNCQSLRSLKVSDCSMLSLVEFFRSASSLQEFVGGSFNDQEGDAAASYNNYYLPPTLVSLGLTDLGPVEMPIIFPYGTVLKKLDLQLAMLSTEEHCQLIPHCPNLEILEVRDVVGDRGLEVISRTCKRLRRLRVERGYDDQGVEDEQGWVSQVGMSAIAHGCRELEYLAIHVTDITNAGLESIGTFSQNLIDFRLVLLDRREKITELPLDNGVRALLVSCHRLRRFSFYVRHGGLSDVGLGYIGRYGNNIRYMLLGNVGESDHGLALFSRGCVSLERFELRSCLFSERALALAVTQLRSLRYIWVQGYEATQNGQDLAAMVRPFWYVEFFPPRLVPGDDGQGNHPAQFLGYYSLAGRRSDIPDYVIPFGP